MRPSERVAVLARELDLAPGHFWFGGSAALALRDIRHVNDLDVGVPTAYWFQLFMTRNYQLYTPPLDEWNRNDPPYLITTLSDGTEAHFFHAWRWRAHDETTYNDFNTMWREGIEIVKGWPCAKLRALLHMKVDAVQWEAGVRQKDLDDIRLIAEAIRREAQ